MNRLAPLGTLTLVICLIGPGCARGRPSLPPHAASDPLSRTPTPAPASLPELNPIQTSINQGKIPSDPTTVRASYTPEVSPSIEEASPAPVPVAEPEPAPVEEPKPKPVDEPKPKPATPRPADDAAPLPVLPPRPAGRTPGATPPAAGSAEAIKVAPDLSPGEPAGLTAARVNETVITYRQLKSAVLRRLGCSPAEMEQIPADQLNMMAKDVLDGLIDRTLLIQEARHEMKKPQQWALFSDYVDKKWRETEVANLCRKAKVADELSLRRKLEEQGIDLDELHEDYKTQQMSTEFLMMRVQPKVEKPTLPEIRQYYAKHRDDHQFHRDAQIRWREILIPKDPNPAAAKAKADALREKLVKGENFAKLAKSESQGVRAAEGGLWETAPGSYSVKPVNDVLEKLPIGEISPTILGPKAYHLVVVESRRVAGPASFVEAQKEVAKILFEDRFQTQIASFLKKLHDKSAISSPLFENTESAPSVVNSAAKKDVQTRPASAK